MTVSKDVDAGPGGNPMLKPARTRAAQRLAAHVHHPSLHGGRLFRQVGDALYEVRPAVLAPERDHIPALRLPRRATRASRPASARRPPESVSCSARRLWTAERRAASRSRTPTLERETEEQGGRGEVLSVTRAPGVLCLDRPPGYRASRWVGGQKTRNAWPTMFSSGTGPKKRESRELLRLSPIMK